MGTNYYIQKPACLTCGHPTEATHIGKSSMGWSFLLGSAFRSWQEWKSFISLNSDRIFDEYGERIEASELIKIVESGRDVGEHWEPHEDPSKYEFRDPEGYRISNRDFC